MRGSPAGICGRPFHILIWAFFFSEITAERIFEKCIYKDPQPPYDMISGITKEMILVEYKMLGFCKGRKAEYDKARMQTVYL